MSLLSEASETMAGQIPIAEQEPVQKECKFLGINSRRTLVYLKSSSSYFRPVYHFANFTLSSVLELKKNIFMLF